MTNAAVEIGQTYKQGTDITVKVHAILHGTAFCEMWKGEESHDNPVTVSVSALAEGRGGWKLIDPLPLPEGWVNVRLAHYKYTNPFTKTSITVDPGGVYTHDEKTSTGVAVMFPIKDLPELVALIQKDEANG